MLNARNELLKSLADEYELALSETTPSKHDNTKKIEEGTKRLAALKERYELLMTTFPVWPFAVQEIRRLVAAVGLSALISLIPLIVNLVMHK